MYISGFKTLNYIVDTLPKSVLSGPFFSCIWTEYGDLLLRIQSEYRKIRTRKKLRIWTFFTQLVIQHGRHKVLHYVYGCFWRNFLNI